MESSTPKNLLKAFKADKVKNANVIPEFLKLLESARNETVTSAIEGLHTIFTQLLIDGDIKVLKDLPDKLMTASHKFTSWLLNLYDDTYQKLLSLLKHEDQSVQELSLCCLVKLMQREGSNPIRVNPGDAYNFPKYRLKSLIAELVSHTEDTSHLIGLLVEYMEFHDFMFHTLVILGYMVKSDKKKKTEVYINNLFPLLELIDFPDEGSHKYKSPKLFLDQPVEDDNEIKDEDKEPAFTIPYPKAKKALNLIWPAVLKYPLTNDLYRRCLIHIPEKVMPHLESPVRLTDFFMESYDMGGAISLLALQGVFILIHKHNLDYPEFYTKLYALLQPDIFQAKYKPRFFMLLDRFLSSSHIPEYLVAAFVKRLARLSLVAPATCLVLILKFIVNLLRRFPGLKKLLHNPAVERFEDDPYDVDEMDPVKSRASESSLWELDTIQNHALPAVGRAANFLSKNLPDKEVDISNHVETTYDEVFDFTCKIPVYDSVSKTFHQPKGLFSYEDDKMSEAWSLL